MKVSQYVNAGKIVFGVFILNRENGKGFGIHSSLEDHALSFLFKTSFLPYEVKIDLFWKHGGNFALKSMSKSQWLRYGEFKVTTSEF